MLLDFNFCTTMLLQGCYRCHHRGHSALPPSGAPVASSTIVAVSGLAGARAHSLAGCSSSSGIIDSTPPSSAAESFSQDDLLALVRDKFVRLMQQQTILPLSVQLAPQVSVVGVCD